MSAPFNQEVAARVLETFSAVASPTASVRPVPMTKERLDLIVVGAVFTSIGLMAMLLRQFTIFLRNRPFAKDDWCMSVAWLSSVGMTIASYISLQRGLGLDLSDISSENASSAIQATFVVEVFYYISLYFIKMSLLFLILRIVADTRGIYYRLAIAFTALMTVHFFTTVVVVSTQCIPTYKYWQPSTPGTCIDITAFFYSVNIFTIVTDIALFALPIPILWQLQRPRSQRILLVATFAIGFVATAASAARLGYIALYTHSTQPLRDAAPLNTWSFIEINLGILCASVPSIKPLFPTSRHETSHSLPSTPPTSRPASRPASRLSNAPTLSDHHHSTLYDDDDEKALARPESAHAAAEKLYNPDDRAYNRTSKLPPPVAELRFSYAPSWRSSLAALRPSSRADSLQARVLRPSSAQAAAEDASTHHSSVVSYVPPPLPVVVSTSLTSDEMLAVMRGRLVVAVATTPRDELRDLRLWPRNTTPREELEDGFAVATLEREF